MATDLIPLDHYRNTFYQREIYFERFLALSEEQLTVLSKNIYKIQEAMTSDISRKLERTSKLERYQKTLQYLTSSNLSSELKTFDAKIAYLIMIVDPNLITFKEFLQANLISSAEITKIENEQERNYLKDIRKKHISKYQSIVREKIGFFDVKLLKYEEMFFKNFFHNKSLITEAENNNEDNLIIKAKSLKDFNSISDERYEELINIAQTWLSLTPKQINSKIPTYNITNLHKSLGLTSPAEQLAIFILQIDSNLDMLRIYEEESMIKNVEVRIIEEFGYFNEELIILEKKFHNRFCPDKKLSIWTKTKKD